MPTEKGVAFSTDHRDTLFIATVPGTALTPCDTFSASAQRNSVLGVVSHDTNKHRRNQIFEDGFDFSSAVAMQDMAKLKQGVDRTKASKLYSN